jgi:protein TonB
MPLVVSSALHLVAATLLAAPFLFLAQQLPEVPTMMSFVAPMPTPPPPPPPPPPPATGKAATAAKPAERPSEFVAPVSAPSSIEPETIVAESGVAEGVPGGVEGGIPGGVVGGIVGGLPPEPLPPPPPPPVAAKSGPVRIGGDVHAPALVKRVEPLYPPFAAAAQLEGLVILEAVVDEEGRVTDVTVLRAAHPLLDQQAIAAVKQWRYSPLKLNGKAHPFVLSVTLSFKLKRQKPLTQ